MQPPVIPRSLVLLGVSLALLCCISCGSKHRKVYPVRGKVLVDGAPAEGAIVTLHALDVSEPMDVAPRGYVKADSLFCYQHLRYGRRRPAGDYKVILIWLPPDARANQDGRFPTSSRQVRRRKTSPLDLHVKESPNDLEPYVLKGTERPSVTPRKCRSSQPLRGGRSLHFALHRQYCL